MPALAMKLTQTNHEFSADELVLLDECKAKILKHIDKNIDGAETPNQVSRLLTYRWYINKNIA